MLTVLVGLVLSRLATAQPTDAERQQAKTLYEKGSAEYRAGHYDRAIELFDEAYRLSRAPRLLFNLAQAHRLSGACVPALDYYRRSLAEDPAADNRAEVEDRIREMEQCAKPVEPLPVIVPSAPVVIAPKRAVITTVGPEGVAHRPTAPIVLAASGGVTALAGGIVYWRARAKFRDVESTCPCTPGEFSGWQTATRVSYVLIGAGSLAAVGGVVWWRLAPTSIRQISPTSTGVQFTTAF